MPFPPHRLDHRPSTPVPRLGRDDHHRSPDLSSRVEKTYSVGRSMRISGFSHRQFCAAYTPLWGHGMTKPDGAVNRDLHADLTSFAQSCCARPSHVPGFQAGSSFISRSLLMSHNTGARRNLAAARLWPRQRVLPFLSFARYCGKGSTADVREFTSRISAGEIPAIGLAVAAVLAVLGVSAARQDF